MPHSSNDLTNRAEPNPAIHPAVRPDYSPVLLTEWFARHDQLCARAKQGGIDVLFLGDSLIECWEKQGAPVWQEIVARYRAANFGRSGDRTQQVLWRITHGELENISPIVTVLLIGTNNLDPGLGENSATRRNTPDETIAGILAVVREVKHRLPRSKILLLGLFPRGEKNSRYRSEVPAINAGLARLAPALHVRFLDLTSLFLPPSDELDPSLMPDKLHLSVRGYRLWADALLPELSALTL
jgi:lysophospholipase L1-like esterase